MLVIDLARARLMATRHIGHMNMTDQVEIIADRLGQVAFANLLMVDVVQQLDVRAMHFFDDLKALGG